MTHTYEGDFDARGLRAAIVVSRFNENISRRLLEGALDCLHRHGVASDDISIAWVPGAFEIPLVAKRLAGSGRIDAVVCLGAVIRGQTAHFDFVAGKGADGIAAVALETEIPVVFGVLTTDTVEQASERAGGKLGNKGFDAALAAIEMVNLLATLPKTSPDH